ncbi:MAG: alpha/beta hydrolase [Chloroflexi bacterium]|nr:alpha/beta hydrolase [Chloroflexota bacterium]
MAVVPKKVFLDYTQEELDRAYDQRTWARNAEALIALRLMMSAQTRKRLTFTSHSYGPDPDETLDVFPSAAANAPIAIFIHGGAWRTGTKEDVSFVAEAFAPAGVHCVILNFDNIAKARMPDMICRGVVWTYRNAKNLGGDSGRMYVLGHSSGAHLCNVMLTTDWARYGMPARLGPTAAASRTWRNPCSGPFPGRHT